MQTALSFENLNKDLPPGVPPYTAAQAMHIKNTQYKKSELLIKYSHRMLNKHFSNWVKTGLIFCAVGAQGLIGQWVAEFLCRLATGVPFRIMKDHEKLYKYSRVEEEEDIKHDDFVVFLHRQCQNFNSIKRLSCVRNHQASLKLVADGADIMKDPRLSDFKKFYQDTCVCLPSNNQFLEKLFKLCSGLDVVNRSETEKSELLFFFSIITRHAKEIAFKLSNGKKSVSAARGSYLGVGLYRRMLEAINIAEAHPSCNEIYEKHYSFLKDPKKHYTFARSTKEVVHYMQKRDHDTFVHNARTKVRGMVPTDTVNGIIAISELRSPLIEDVRVELELRGYSRNEDFNRSTKITPLVKLLKDQLIESGEAKDSDDKPTNDPKAIKRFKPQSQALIDKVTGLSSVTGGDDNDKVKLQWITAGNGHTYLLQAEMTTRGIPFEPADRMNALKLKMMNTMCINANDLFLPASPALKEIQPQLREQNEQRD